MAYSMIVVKTIENGNSHGLVTWTAWSDRFCLIDGSLLVVVGEESDGRRKLCLSSELLHVMHIGKAAALWRNNLALQVFYWELLPTLSLSLCRRMHDAQFTFCLASYHGYCNSMYLLSSTSVKTTHQPPK